MKFEIVDLELDRVDSVKHPANTDSRVLLAKSGSLLARILSDVAKGDGGELPLGKILRGAIHAEVKRVELDRDLPFAKALHRTLADPMWSAAYAVSVLPEAWQPVSDAIAAIEKTYPADHAARTLLDSLTR
jgi:hypothetical protein